MTIKRMRPQDARRSLKKLWSSVAVYSCSDGTLKMEPKWRHEVPGFFTRMASAERVAAVLSLPIKKINWVKRSKL